MTRAPRTGVSPLFRPLPVVVAAAVLVVALAVALVGNPLPAVAHVSFDINPSVQLSVDVLMRVVAADAYDEPSKGFLAGMDLMMRPLDESIAALAGRAAEVLPDSGERWLILGATPVDPGKGVPGRLMRLLDHAREQVEANWQESGGQTVPLQGRVLPVPGEVAAAAQEAGVSPGCYVMLLAADAAGVDVSGLAANKAGAVLDAIRGAGLKPGEVLGKAGTGEEVERLWHDRGEHLRGKAAGPGKGKGSDNPGEGEGEGEGEPKGPAKGDPQGPGHGNPGGSGQGKPEDPGDPGHPGQGDKPNNPGQGQPEEPGHGGKPGEPPGQRKDKPPNEPPGQGNDKPG